MPRLRFRSTATAREAQGEDLEDPGGGGPGAEEPDGPRFASDLDYGLWAVQDLLQSELLSPALAGRDESGAVLVAELGGDRFAIHLRVTRRDDDRDDFGPEPPLLTQLCRDLGAAPLRLQLNLTVRCGTTMHTWHGREAVRAELHSDLARWKRHLLGGLDAKAWLDRAGVQSTLRIRMEKGGWPYAVIDGAPPRFPQLGHYIREDPPVHPGELCRSVTTDDECWLFTCECGSLGCASIDHGILVAHDRGLVVWRCPERPEIPMAVFDLRQYRSAALSALRALVRGKPKPMRMSLSWTSKMSPKWLRQALKDAHAGRRWW